MSTQSDFDRQLAGWLEVDAPSQEPEQLLGRVLAQTAATRRRRGWFIAERWIPARIVSARAVTMSRGRWGIVGLVVILVLALSVGAAVYIGSRPHALPAPFGPAANGLVVYSRDGDIVTHDATSGVERTMVGGPDDDIIPTFSHDGSRLAFFRGTSDLTSDLWVADQDGTNPRRIGGPFRQPGWIDWSPSGDAIVVESIVDDKLAMTVVATDGSDKTTYLDVGMGAVLPTFRPSNGDQLMFRGQDENGVAGLYLVDRDGGNLVRLGLDPGLQAAGFPSGFNVGYFDFPSWSPDGRRITFQSYSPMPGALDGRGPRIHVADIGPTGAVTGERTLVDDPVARLEGLPVWLPGSDGIVFKRNEPDALDHLALTMLTPGPTAARDLGVKGAELGPPMVSPDGMKVMAFVGDGGPADTDPPLKRARLSDLTSGESTDAGFASGWPPSWQRTAP